MEIFRLESECLREASCLRVVDVGGLWRGVKETLDWVLES